MGRNWGQTGRFSVFPDGKLRKFPSVPDFSLVPVLSDSVVAAAQLRSQRPRAAGRGEAANENPHTGSHHLIVERVDIAGHRFGFDGRVVIVGLVNSNADTAS